MAANYSPSGSHSSEDDNDPSYGSEEESGGDDGGNADEEDGGFDLLNVDPEEAAAAAEVENQGDQEEGFVDTPATSSRGGARGGQEEEEEERGDADVVEIERGDKMDGGGESQSSERVELDRSMLASCPVCFEPWTSEGAHRICCIPCGHVYGRSCLEKWARECRNNSGKCPQCNRKFRKKEIINLYAPLLIVRDDRLEKELDSLRTKNELLELEKACLLGEIVKQKKHRMEAENSQKLKKTRMDCAASEVAQRSLFEYSDERWVTSACVQEPESVAPRTGRAFLPCRFALENELMVDGARVLGIDASSQIAIISRKAPGVGREHLLCKISLLAQQEIYNIQLPPNTGAIRDISILPGRPALLGSLGRKLALFSMESNHLVLKYDLPGPIWSCSYDLNSQNDVYAGLQNGMLFWFDIRQTARHVASIEGLSKQPIHTIHSIVQNDSTRKVLTASSSGPCIWDIGGSVERPHLIRGLENCGVCISLACSSSGDDLVASFRPKVELSNDVIPSQTSMSPSPPVSGSWKLATHVLIKKLIGSSYEPCYTGYGHVSEVRMSKAAVVSTEHSSPLFAYGDESLRGISIWDLPSFLVCKRLKPHQSPILDVKYSQANSYGFLGCISENRFQLYSCY